MRRALFLLFLFYSLSNGLGAQPGSTSVDEVNFEKRFIEAKREALLGNTEIAIDRFEELIKDAPDNDVLYFEIGRLFFTREKNTEAVEALEKAYALNNQAVYARLLGEVYMATGQNKAGAKLYEKLAKAQPDQPDLHLQQALFLVRGQDIDGAIDVYDKLEKRLGVTPDLSRRKHALYLGKGQTSKAEKELENLIEAYPENLDYRHLLAGFYASQGNRSAALRTYRAILAIEPADVKAQLAVSERDSTQPVGDNGELMGLFGRPDVPLDLKIGRILPLVQRVASEGDRSVAERGLALAAELRRVHPDEAKVWAVTGDLYYHTGRYAEAAEFYGQTLERDDTVYPVWEQLLHALYLDNQAVQLRARSEEALDVFPNRPYVYFYAALGEVARGDFDEAVSLMQQAEFIFSAANPESGVMARSYVAALERLSTGQLPEVQLTQVEGDPLILYLEAKKKLAAGEAREALSMLSNSDHDRNTNALLLELRGDALLALDQKEAANTAYQQAKSAGSISSSLSAKIAQTRS